MAIVTDIVVSWRHPRAVIARKLADGVREDRALATAMGAGMLAFVGQWPALSRAAALDPSVPMDARMGGALLATIFLLPLLAYGFAAASHLVARAFGGRGSFYSARLALFWAMIAASPVVLLHGLIRGFLGQGMAATVLGVLVLAGFVYLWLAMLIEAEN